MIHDGDDEMMFLGMSWLCFLIVIPFAGCALGILYRLFKFCMRFAERASACGGILGVGYPVFHSGSNFCNISTVAYENIREIVSLTNGNVPALSVQ